MVTMTTAMKIQSAALKPNIANPPVLPNTVPCTEKSAMKPYDP
jgi:hypothetical protein